MKLWKKSSDWAFVNSKMVAGGSAAQMANVLEMAIQDLLAMDAALSQKQRASIAVRPMTDLITFRHN